MLSSKLLSASPSMARNLVAFSSSVTRSTTASSTKFALKKHQYFPNQRFCQNSRRTFTSRTESSGASKLSEKTAPMVKHGSFLQRWMAHKEIPLKGTLNWYGEMVLICTVFAITGTSTMVLVRPAVSEVLGLKGSLKDGPWSYRICSIVIMTPLYSAMLVVVGVSTNMNVKSFEFVCFL